MGAEGRDGKEIFSASLQRQPGAQGAIDGANRLSLPFQHGRLSPEEVTETACAHCIDDSARKAEQNEHDAQNRQLKGDQSVLGPHELRKGRRGRPDPSIIALAVAAFEPLSIGPGPSRPSTPRRRKDASRIGAASEDPQPRGFNSACFADARCAEPRGWPGRAPPPACGSSRPSANGNKKFGFSFRFILLFLPKILEILPPPEARRLSQTGTGAKRLRPSHWPLRAAAPASIPRRPLSG